VLHVDNVAERTQRQIGRPSTAQNFRNQVMGILQEEPDLATLEILRRVRETGYPGGKTALYALVASLRPRSAKPLVRFAGLPGEFSQHDFGQVQVKFLDGACLGQDSQRGYRAVTERKNPYSHHLACATHRWVTSLASERPERGRDDSLTFVVGSDQLGLRRGKLHSVPVGNGSSVTLLLGILITFSLRAGSMDPVHSASPARITSKIEQSVSCAYVDSFS
jgi:hypothetical protein